MPAKIILTGNIGGKINTNIDGDKTPPKAYAFFSIADSQDESTKVWYNIKVFGKDAEYVAKFLKSGSKVLVFGKLEFGEHNGKETKTVIAFTVEGFFSGKSENQISEQITNDKNIQTEMDLPF